MSRDLHDERFDEATKAKLVVYRDYVRSWLPVFLAVKNVRWTKVNIFDFFAGPGSDVSGTKGSPLIIIDELFPYFTHIRQKNISVVLFLNEFDRIKASFLEKTIQEIKERHSLPYEIKISCFDFKDAFKEHYPRMTVQKSANLLLLDQSGIKHITKDIFLQITELKTTDFLFFISSSTIRRFSGLASMKQYIRVDATEVRATEYYKIHKLVLEHYRGLIPENRTYYLAPFSIKKGSNVYGLIFGTGHILGMQKFLQVCWKADPQRGEANFDIDRENIIPGQMGLFTGDVEQPKKVDLFESELCSGILEGRLATDQDVYLFSITNGFLPKHARKVMKTLVKKGALKRGRFLLDSDIMKPEHKKNTLELISDGN
jgi:three-Cys-motif partner protein